ncbi:unnamed protein product, partial [Candidula unifasciata]
MKKMRKMQPCRILAIPPLLLVDENIPEVVRLSEIHALWQMRNLLQELILWCLLKVLLENTGKGLSSILQKVRLEVYAFLTLTLSVLMFPQHQKSLEDLCPDVICLKDVCESMTEISDTQQRNLNSWCFAEHYKPDIFLQVLQEATYYLPYIEVYHANREEAVMLVLHNPYNRERQNNSNWHSELHSNTGFRNYQENTVESIQTWLKMKETEYKAARLSRETASLQKDEEEKQKTLEKAEKKGKRSPQRSGKIRSPGLSSTSSLEVQSTSLGNPYVRQGSLKAYQAEQMKQANEEEEKERSKAERLSRSAQKLKEKKEKEKTDKTRKSSIKMGQSKRNSETMSDLVDTSQTAFNVENQPVEEEYTLP